MIERYLLSIVTVISLPVVECLVPTSYVWRQSYTFALVAFIVASPTLNLFKHHVKSMRLLHFQLIHPFLNSYLGAFIVLLSYENRRSQRQSAVVYFCRCMIAFAIAAFFFALVA